MLSWLNMLFGTELSWHGWIAITAGIVGIVGLNTGLMMLAVFSNRKGYDTAADDFARDRPAASRD